MNEETLDSICQMLVRLLKRYPDECWSAKSLCDFLAIPERELRDVIQATVRDLRIPIVSTFNDGYRLAYGFEDLMYRECIAQRKAVAKANFEAVKAIEDAMEEWYGQEKLLEV